ncbi:hypothetical protein Acr_15g0010350 [Actinidia rufa]|uniref:Disease resistance protein At4g27190-like leucine-rich repeats domain-containing protein n=1 Tax=Actinidia rufa TaxID=165716 RepID=A0A7J0FVF5_9ERIC|nr:hypothetical protein Acr_15g0010350 [Actinidia rufa]
MMSDYRTGSLPSDVCRLKAAPNLFPCLKKKRKGSSNSTRGLPNIMNLECLGIYDCEKLEMLPRGLPSKLRTLLIIGCDSLQSLPELMMLNSLEKLMVEDCSALTCLCPGAGLPSTIKQLHIESCGKLEAVLAEGMTINCPSLESIDIRVCDNLKTLPDVIQNNDLRNLNTLVIQQCDNLESLPERMVPHNQYERIGYNKDARSSMPSHKGVPSPTSQCLPSATSISPYQNGACTGLPLLENSILKILVRVSFPEDVLSLPRSLIRLWILRFPNLVKLSSKVLQALSSLEEFYIKVDCPMVTSIAELGVLPSLSNLCIGDCPNLASIARLGLLPSLSKLWIFDCPNLASFPEQGLPLSLLQLHIRGLSDIGTAV